MPQEKVQTMTGATNTTISTMMIKPMWLKRTLPTGMGISNYSMIKQNLDRLHLNTVCEEAKCPNINECWSGGTATFMVMGDECTRGCRFCAVKTRRIPKPLDNDEPKKLAEAIKNFGLKYVVFTSVDRDDLPDQGAGHFAGCIREIKARQPELIVEVLIPDFQGKKELIKMVADAKPEVIAHNIETVKRLQSKIRDPRANYEQSLGVLKTVKELDKKIYTKSSIMLGFDEQDDEVLEAIDDLRAIDVDVLTLGQYLRPSQNHIALQKYVSPDKFEWFKQRADEKGFLYTASGPFVRSSYKAAEFFMEGIIRKQKIAESVV